MQIKYSPSINILRDSQQVLNYIPTKNTTLTACQIAENFQRGVRVFNIIGSFGTGKSAFLWAFSKTLTGAFRYFDIDDLAERDVEVVPIVGEFSSLFDFFTVFFKIKDEPTPEKIFLEIFQRYHKLGKSDKLLVLVIDEFGKFLEFAARKNPEKELYFLQQFAEFVNDPNHDIILITTLHQNFDAYSYSLQEPRRHEWQKVRGRFRELTFNEPVEQLLLLAGERMNQFSEFSGNKKHIEESVKLFQKSKAFKLSKGFAADLGFKLYPLELFSGAITALSMQRYGQNERSMFSFLEDTNYTGVHKKYEPNTFYNVANLYDYLIFNYYSFLSSKYNPDFLAWSAIKNALERAENEIVKTEFITDAQKTIKAVGLINIFTSKGADLGYDFLKNYMTGCMGIQKAEEVLETLLNHKIFLYRNYEKKFVLSEGTDIDIQTELLLAEDQIGQIENVVNLLNKYFDFPPVFAKEYYYKTGTPRIFDFIISNRPEKEFTFTEDTDGFVNLIFNEKLSVQEICEISKNTDSAVLYGYYTNSTVIRELLREIEKTKKTIENIPKDDRVAHRELTNIKLHQETLLNHYILDNLHSHSATITWIFKGDKIKLKSKKEFNSFLSKICEEVYSKTPNFSNELVNRSSIPSQIHTAKRNYFKHLVNFWGDENLGFQADKFPPQKTIFITLLKANGLYPDPNKPFEPISINKNSTFLPLWLAGQEFFNRAKKNRLPLSEFIDSLRKPPFKLKRGLIDFWIPTFLFLNREDFALFANDIYIPKLSAETLELTVKRPSDFSLKVFDVEGVRLDIFNSYRKLLNQVEKEKADNQTFIETVRPFLVFYKGLPNYSKNTNRLRKESLAIRNAIAKATDPEKTFFEDFPRALGISLSELKKSPEKLGGYISSLENSIREIRTSFDELVNRFESFLLDEVLYEKLKFKAYKQKLNERFASVKPHLLLPHQKTFLLRLSSQLDNRAAWLNSLAQAVAGKTLENLKDEDEAKLYDKFKEILFELDALSELAGKVDNDQEDEVFGLQIASFEKITKQVVRYPKKKKVAIQQLEEQLKIQLGKDKTLNIAALANVIKELLKK